MLFCHVDPARIDREWPAIAETLAPAVRQDPGQTLEGLHARLLTGPDVLLSVSGEANGLIVFEVTDDRVCWTKYIGGCVTGGPKRRTGSLRETMRQIEAVARDAGCTEHRICGRDWSRIFPEYEPFDGARNGLRKVLR